jgi:hypothetical protein
MGVSKSSNFSNVFSAVFIVDLKAIFLKLYVQVKFNEFNEFNKFY